MTIHLKRLKIGYFAKDYVCPPDQEGSYKIFGLVNDGKLSTIGDIAKLSKVDKENARTSFIKFHKHAVTGQPFRETFDGGQFHTGHEFKYKDRPVTIWRLWLAGDIRIYIYFLPDHTIACLRTLSKRENDLSNREKKDLENIAKIVIDCSDADLVSFV